MANKNKLRFHIKLSRNRRVTGQEIADVVAQVTGEEYYQKPVFGLGGTLFMIGRNSWYPWRDAVIGVTPNPITHLSLTERYADIWLLEWTFKGPKQETTYSEDELIDLRGEALHTLRSQLQTAFLEIDRS